MAVMCCLILMQCAHAPDMGNITNDPEVQKMCLSIFPAKQFRAVHRIEADLPFGGYSAFVGVTEVNPDNGLVKVVMVSSEGITLLDAEGDSEGLTINAGIPPLDKKEYAAGIIEGIRFLFLPPEGVYAGARANTDGSSSCFWKKDGIVTEIVPVQTHAVLRELNESGKIIREAVLELPSGSGMYSKIILEVKGIAGCRLDLELLESEDSKENQ